MKPILEILTAMLLPAEMPVILKLPSASDTPPIFVPTTEIEAPGTASPLEVIFPDSVADCANKSPELLQISMNKRYNLFLMW